MIYFVKNNYKLRTRIRSRLGDRTWVNITVISHIVLSDNIVIHINYILKLMVLSRLMAALLTKNADEDWTDWRVGPTTSAPVGRSPAEPDYRRRICYMTPFYVGCRVTVRCQHLCRYFSMKNIILPTVDWTFFLLIISVITEVCFCEVCEQHVRRWCVEVLNHFRNHRRCRSRWSSVGRFFRGEIIHRNGR